jgi:hypothetical protein
MSLTPVRDQRAHLFELTLRDDMRAAVSVDSMASLDFNGASLGTGLDASRLLDDFRDARAVGEADGLAFGRLLFDCLMSDVANPELPAVRDLWAEIETARLARQVPLRLELALPRGTAAVVADIPFELLADEGGFLFRRAGHVLVRTFQGMSGVRALIRRGDRATVVWANPLIDTEAGTREALPAAIFGEHDRALAEAGRRLGLAVIPPLQHPTRPAFDRHLHQHSPQIVAVVAHGDRSGGVLLFHDDRRADYPSDPGRPIHASDVAATFREAKVRIAFLWSCHGARRHPDSGRWPRRCLIPGRATWRP